MIKKLGQVMIYVNNQEEAVRFWTEQMGFTLLNQGDLGGEMKWFEIAVDTQAQTSLVLHNKKLVEAMNSGINLGTPSLLFYTEDIQALHDKLSKNQVKVGEIIEMEIGKTFNFPDNEGNYFAILETIK